LPSQPASVPAILASPISAIASCAERRGGGDADVVQQPPGSIGPHISVTKAGKCAVMKPSW
jgi:hypothetical protein